MQPHAAGGTQVRLAEVLAALSLATDLAMGQPMGHGLRACLLGARLGESLGLERETLAEVYLVALLRHIGCTGDAHELQAIFGDDLAAHARSLTLDLGRPLEVLLDVLRFAGAGRPAGERARHVARALRQGQRIPGLVFQASCEVARGLATQLGLPSAVRQGLDQSFERWDGQGFPRRLQGEQIALSARVVQVAEYAEVCRRLESAEGALSAVKRRGGSALDPVLAAHFALHGAGLFNALDADSAWEAVLAAEPSPQPPLSEERLDAALQVMAEFADLKSPHTTGHSTGVAQLAADAGRRLGMPRGEIAVLRGAGLVHDLGRVAVANGVWEKSGRLSDGEWEQVRLHGYYTERVLARSPALARLGALAGLHHERLDGSGYHRGSAATGLSRSARILAAADVCQAMREHRPHRAALEDRAVADELRRAVRAGKLDGEAVDAVLQAAGHRVRRQRKWPLGLTAREVEVLRLMARGQSNREMAGALGVAEPTIAHHVQHIYTKIGVSTRAGAALFAMQHGLLESAVMSEW